MNLTDLSFTATFDEESLLKVITGELQEQLPEQTVFESVLGDIDIRVDSARMHSMTIQDGNIRCNLDMGIAVTPRWGRSFLSYDGTFAVDIRVSARLEEDAFVQTEVSLSDLFWNKGPYIHIGSKQFSAIILKLMSKWLKAPMIKMINKKLGKYLDQNAISTKIAQQLKPIPVKENLNLIIGELSIRLSTLILDNGILHLNGETDLELHIDEGNHQVDSSIRISAEAPHKQNDQAAMSIQFRELNGLAITFLDEINEQILDKKHVLSQLLFSGSGDTIIVEVEATRPSGAGLAVAIQPSINTEEQLIELADIQIGPGPKSGLIIKALTRTLSGLIQRMIKRQFPVQLDPMVSAINLQLKNQAPSFLNLSLSHFLVDNMEIKNEGLQISVRSVLKMTTTHLDLEKGDQGSKVTSPET